MDKKFKDMNYGERQVMFVSEVMKEILGIESVDEFTLFASEFLFESLIVNPFDSVTTAYNYFNSRWDMAILVEKKADLVTHDLFSCSSPDMVYYEFSISKK